MPTAPLSTASSRPLLASRTSRRRGRPLTPAVRTNPGTYFGGVTKGAPARSPERRTRRLVRRFERRPVVSHERRSPTRRSTRSRPGSRPRRTSGRQDHRLRQRARPAPRAATTVTSTCRTTASSSSAPGPARRTPSRRPAAYNDGSWHHVVATQARRRHEALRRRRAAVGTNPQTSAQDYDGLLARRRRHHVGLVELRTSTAPSTRSRSTLGARPPTHVAAPLRARHRRARPTCAPTAAFTATPGVTDGRRRRLGLGRLRRHGHRRLRLELR